MRHLEFRFKCVRSIERAEVPSRSCASKHMYAVDYTAVTIAVNPQTVARRTKRGRPGGEGILLVDAELIALL